MNDTVKHAVLSHGGLLFIVALLVAFIVALVNDSTRELIAEQQSLAEQQILQQVMPSNRHDNDLTADTFPLTSATPPFRNIELLGLTEPASGYIARQDGSFNGVILPARITDGYSGEINILVGITPDGSISGVRVLEHRETPGLGDKIELRVSDWILGFNGKSLANPPAGQWAVRKDGGVFDQFVGATITPRAVVNGVQKALTFYRENRDRIMLEEL